MGSSIFLYFFTKRVHHVIVMLYLGPGNGVCCINNINRAHICHKRGPVWPSGKALGW